MTAKRAAKRLGLVLAVLLFLTVAFVFFTPRGQSLYFSLMAPYPPEWQQVVPGMTSAEARQLLGQPTADGRELKEVDIWRTYRNGVEMELDLNFEGNWFDSSKITAVRRRKHSLFGDSVEFLTK